MKIAKLFETIESTSSNTEKMEVMNANINETVKMIYADCYDKQRNYGVKKFNVTNSGSMTIDNDYAIFHDMLDTLNSREVTGNAAIELVESTISKFKEDDQKVLESIMDRKLTIGLSKVSFDKLLGVDAPNNFEVTLAFLLDKVKGVNVLDGTYMASRKCDGCVDANTIIEFENGEKYTIKDIVDHKIQGKVKSFDEKNNKIVYKDIEDWMHNIKDVDNTQKEWFEIQLENGKSLKITANDKVYVKNKGWTRVDQLTENDEILTE